MPSARACAWASSNGAAIWPRNSRCSRDRATRTLWRASSASTASGPRRAPPAAPFTRRRSTGWKGCSRRSKRCSLSSDLRRQVQRDDVSVVSPPPSALERAPIAIASAARLLEIAGAQGGPTSRTAPMRVFVVGEFNTGKTSLINALLGEPFLPTAVAANTAHITVVAFARRRRSAMEAFTGRRVALHGDLAHLPASAPVRRLHV